MITPLDNNIECYLNSRGMGNVNENNVVDKFDLITFDIVQSIKEKCGRFKGRHDGKALV